MDGILVADEKNLLNIVADGNVAFWEYSDDKTSESLVIGGRCVDSDDFADEDHVCGLIRSEQRRLEYISTIVFFNSSKKEFLARVAQCSLFRPRYPQRVVDDYRPRLPLLVFIPDTSILRSTLPFLLKTSLPSLPPLASSASLNDRTSFLLRSPPPHRIAPCLFLGCRLTAMSASSLSHLNVRHVVNATNCPLTMRHDDIHYTMVNIDDTPLDCIVPHLMPCARLSLHPARDGSILYHCHQGVSRSATLTMAALMLRYHLPPSQCATLCQSRRSQVSPNDGFIQQLLQWQKHHIPQLSSHQHSDFVRFSDLVKFPKKENLRPYGPSTWEDPETFLLWNDEVNVVVGIKTKHDGVLLLDDETNPQKGIITTNEQK